MIEPLTTQKIRNLFKEANERAADKSNGLAPTVTPAEKAHKANAYLSELAPLLAYPKPSNTANTTKLSFVNSDLSNINPCPLSTTAVTVKQLPTLKTKHKQHFWFKYPRLATMWYRAYFTIKNTFS